MKGTTVKQGTTVKDTEVSGAVHSGNGETVMARLLGRNGRVTKQEIEVEPKGKFCVGCYMMLPSHPQGLVADIRGGSLVLIHERCVRTYQNRRRQREAAKKGATSISQTVSRPSTEAGLKAELSPFQGESF